MEQIDVKILGRDYRLAVNPDEKGKLLDAVKMVDEKMRSIREAGKLTGIDRIAVMAALQLAHDLLSVGGSTSSSASSELIRRIKKMTDDLDVELKRQESLF